MKHKKVEPKKTGRRLKDSDADHDDREEEDDDWEDIDGKLL